MRLRALSLILASALGACGHDAPSSPATGETVAGLQTLQVSAQPLAEEMRFDATLEAVNRATVAAQTSGRVLELPFDVGDFVEQGAVIARITAKEQQAGVSRATAAVREAEARHADAESEYERTKNLHARGVLSQAALDKATAALQSAKAQLAAAHAAAEASGEQLDYTVVRAPYPGIVVERHVELGETVAPGTPLLTGLSLEQLRAVIDVPQQAIGTVYARRAVRVLLPDGSSVEATQLRISPAADPQTHTFRVLATLPSGRHDNVFPGTLVKVAFSHDERPTLLLPASAVVQRSELTAVYVVDDAARPALRYVTLGTPTVDGRLPVLAGLDAGERIAANPLAAARALKGAAAGKPAEGA